MIEFPETLNRTAGAIHQEMLAIPRPHDVWIAALRIVSHETVFHWCLSAKGEKDVTFMGQIEIGEDSTAFTVSAPAV